MRTLVAPTSASMSALGLTCFSRSWVKLCCPERRRSQPEICRPPPEQEWTHHCDGGFGRKLGLPTHLLHTICDEMSPSLVASGATSLTPEPEFAPDARSMFRIAQIAHRHLSTRALEDTSSQRHPKSAIAQSPRVPCLLPGSRVSRKRRSCHGEPWGVSGRRPSDGAGVCVCVWHPGAAGSMVRRPGLSEARTWQISGRTPRKSSWRRTAWCCSSGRMR